MEKIIATFAKPPSVKIKKDDGIVDRMSSRYSAIILVTFAVVVSITQFVGKPITCWAPKHFTSSHIKYANSYCWVKNTYYLPFDEYIPRPHEDRQAILYYQWLPWIMLTQALFFYAPSVFWHSLNAKAGIDSDDILESAAKFADVKLVEKREAKLKLITIQLNRFFTCRDKQLSTWKRNCKSCLNCLLCKCCGPQMGKYLVSVFLLSKVLYLINIIAQLFVLGDIFQTNYYNFVSHYIEMYTNATAKTNMEYINSPIFPRITMCDFKIRRLGNVQRYTVQCVLPVNLYVEIMYLFFWFWIIMLLALTCVAFLLWFVRIVSRRNRLNFVRNHLNNNKLLQTSRDKELSNKFLDKYLKHDGAFLLRLIHHNTNTITATEIIGSLWHTWNDQRSKGSSIEEETSDLYPGTMNKAMSGSDESIKKDHKDFV